MGDTGDSTAASGGGSRTVPCANDSPEGNCRGRPVGLEHPPTSVPKDPSLIRTGSGLLAPGRLLSLGVVASYTTNDKDATAETPVQVLGKLQVGCHLNLHPGDQVSKAEKAGFPGGIENRTINDRLVSADGDRPAPHSGCCAGRCRSSSGGQGSLTSIDPADEDEGTFDPGGKLEKETSGLTKEWPHVETRWRKSGFMHPDVSREVPFMNARILRATLVTGLALACALATVFAQIPATPTEDKADKADKAAIRKTMEAYTAAYNKGDIVALLRFWANEAEFIDESGNITSGKDAIGARFKKGLAEEKGRTMTVKITALRFPRPDLALLDGTAEIKASDGDSDAGAFASVWAKTGDRWQILSVRDLPNDMGATVNPSAAALRQLDWLVGEWTYEDKESSVTLSCRRTEKQSFLLIEQKVKAKGEEVLSLTMVIGWDPLRQQFRSWVFDSAGGFGAGLWERRGNLWVVGVEGVRSDGLVASALNSWRYVDGKTFEWATTDREIDGEPFPDLKVRFTRKAGKE